MINALKDSKYFGISLALLFLVCAVSFGFAQDKQKVDSRVVTNMYWQKMAEQGLAELNPEVEVQPAVQSRAGANPAAAPTNNPDVVIIGSGVTQSEPSIFVSPLDNDVVLNSNNSTNWPFSVLYGTSGFFTSDGGATWNGSEQGTGGSNSGDPAAVINLDGDYFVGYIAADLGQGVARSTNGGASWQTFTIAPGPGGFFDVLDKNHLWVDNSPSSAHEGNLYAAWTAIVGGSPNNNDIEFSRSTDNGQTWSSVINVSNAVNAGSHSQGVNIKTGPNGEVYCAFAIYDSWPSDETAMGFSVSTNGGSSFSPASRIISNIRGIRTSETSKDQRCSSFPTMAVDISGGPNNGNIYIAWPNIGVPGVNTGNDIDIYMITSTDGGSTWSSPARVNQDPTGLGNEHYMAWMDCDPVTGDLAMVWYDDRNVGSTQCQVWAATSSDGGATWDEGQIGDVTFTPAPIPGLATGYFGDYNGISVRGGKVYPVWTDNRTGVALAYTSPFEIGGAPGGNTPPVADANGPYAADTGDNINFSSAGSFDPDGVIVTYDWDFGDGGNSSSANPTYSYGTAGVYNVTLTVTDDSGAVDIDVTTATITDPGGGIDCADVRDLRARCTLDGGSRLQAMLRLWTNAYDGQQVTFEINGSDQHISTISNSRAVLSLPGYGVGTHSIEVLEVTACGVGPVNATCTSLLEEEGPFTFEFEGAIPETTELQGNYPNPFNPNTTIRYALSESVHVSLKIYNTLGQEVATLVDGYQEAGYRDVQWNGTDNAGNAVASGIYIYRLTAGEVTSTSQMLFSK